MKYLNLSIITLFAVGLSACSNNDNPGPDQTQSLPKVKSITSDGVAYATLSYNAKGQLTTIDYVNSNNISSSRADKFTYDASGKLVKAVNPVDSTQYTYSGDGKLQQSDSFTEWRLNKDGSGLDHRTVYNYNANGDITSITFSDGTKQNGQTPRFTVTYEYSNGGTLSSLTYKYGDDPGQKFIVEGGYTPNVKLNPLILERVTSMDYYFGVGGIAKLTENFPKAIRNYENGQIVEGFGFNFDISDTKVNKIEAKTTLPNSELTINYEFQYQQ